MAQQLNHFRKKFTFIFLNGAAGADLVQTKGIACAGEILHLIQINGLNTGTRTAQIKILDENDILIHDAAAQAHNSTVNHEFVANRRVLTGEDKMTMTISGDPGVSGYVITVIFEMFGRDA